MKHQVYKITAFDKNGKEMYWMGSDQDDGTSFSANPQYTFKFLTISMASQKLVELARKHRKMEMMIEIV